MRCIIYNLQFKKKRKKKWNIFVRNENGSIKRLSRDTIWIYVATEELWSHVLLFYDECYVMPTTIGFVCVCARAHTQNNENL